MDTVKERRTADAGVAPISRSELLVQLYYDRADVALHDRAAARIIDMAIAMLTHGSVGRTLPSTSPRHLGDRRLH